MTADPAWYEWAFWAKDSGSLRDLALISAALVGAPLLVWRTWAVAKGAAASRSQARTAVEAHLTDRLAKAFEQLVSERVETKLAGLYVLERLAKTSGDLHWPIVKSLSAYVQENSRFVDWVARESGEEPVTQEPAEHWWSEARPPREVGFIVRVICDRNKKFDPPDGHVNLWGSRLNGIDFRASDLKKADFTLCNLRGANFSGSSLRSARFVHARLEGAVFNGADLADADLTGAHLGSADLTRTKGLSQRQLDEAVGDERTKLPEGLSIGAGTEGHHRILNDPADARKR